MEFGGSARGVEPVATVKSISMFANNPIALLDGDTIRIVVNFD